MLYFAYGSNLWRQQMRMRCPGHHVAGTGILLGWRWIITTRGYASIVPSAADYVLGTVYELSEDDIRTLDRFEGVALGNYRKEMVNVALSGQELDCLVYIDRIDEDGSPKAEYITRINNGIQDAGFPDEYVTRYLRTFISSRPQASHTPPEW